MTQVKLNRLNKVFPGKEKVYAVQDLDLEIDSGMITALLGPSGCGKTTTLKMIAGLLPILVMLTAGSMGPLLSPTEDAESTDMNLVINSDQVLYLGLDSLSDPMVGSTIGSLALADLASTAGEI